MDIVIPLSDRSIWDHNELRFALRSAEKFIPDMGKVFIIGNKPHWIKNVINIVVQDKPEEVYKEHNICNKVLAACKHNGVSNDFIFMNDDHFLLAPFTGDNYYQQSLSATLLKRASQDTYYRSLNNTLRSLQHYSLPTLNFDIHCPIIYNKREFAKVVSLYDWEKSCGYVIKSLYCNTLRLLGIVDMDLKINTQLNCFQLEALTMGRKFFSVGDGAVGGELATYLNYLYPKKSQFE